MRGTFCETNAARLSLPVGFGAQAEVAREQNDALMIELRQTETENGEYEVDRKA